MKTTKKKYPQAEENSESNSQPMNDKERWGDALLGYLQYNMKKMAEGEKDDNSTHKKVYQSFATTSSDIQQQESSTYSIGVDPEESLAPPNSPTQLTLVFINTPYELFIVKTFANEAKIKSRELLNNLKVSMKGYVEETIRYFDFFIINPTGFILIFDRYLLSLHNVIPTNVLYKGGGRMIEGLELMTDGNAVRLNPNTIQRLGGPYYLKLQEVTNSIRPYVSLSSIVVTKLLLGTANILSTFYDFLEMSHEPNKQIKHMIKLLSSYNDKRKNEKIEEIEKSLEDKNTITIEGVKIRKKLFEEIIEDSMENFLDAIEDTI